MYLKEYQLRVIDELSFFFSSAIEKKEQYYAIKKINSKLVYNWVEQTETKSNIKLKHSRQDGLKQYYPNVVMKVPTGGGKTILAVNAISKFQNLFAKRRNGLVVWVIPTEAIYSQTVNSLKDKRHPYRQVLDQSTGGNTIILEKGQRLTNIDLENNLVILFVMIQSVNRSKQEALKIFKDTGGLDDLFPPDHRYDLHQELYSNYPNLEIYSEIGISTPIVKSSLANAIKISKALIIIDEIHKVNSELAKQTVDDLNPEMVLGLTATPDKDMNLICKVSGLELKKEEMIKLDIHVFPPPNTAAIFNYKNMLDSIISHRNNLEIKAKKLKNERKLYIRPIALIQVERIGKDQRGNGFVHTDDVIDYLVKNKNININEIAVKTSQTDDLKIIGNLLSEQCEIRYIITKDALKEGWDCPFAYILGIIPNLRSNRSGTQLIGRILRQPFAQKLNIPELDESYIYFCRGNSNEMVNNIITSFKDEGLEDLNKNIKVKTDLQFNSLKQTKIKQNILSEFNESLYLPVWLMIEDTNSQVKRRFSYTLDILEQLDYKIFEFTDDMANKINSSISNQLIDYNSLRITVNDKNKVQATSEYMIVENKEREDIIYFCRRISEVVENPFMAMYIARNTNLKIKDKILEYSKNFSFIVTEVVKLISEFKANQEEEIFKSYLNDKKLILGVTKDLNYGYRVPSIETIFSRDNHVNEFNQYLFDDVDIQTFNTLEMKVAKTLDRQERILWWFRNNVSQKGYAIQGWKKNKIRPDFIAAKKDDENKLEIVYILEAKGNHLKGNPDTSYKENIFETFNHNAKQINIFQDTTDVDKLNDNYEAHFVYENEEESKIRELYN